MKAYVSFLFFILFSTVLHAQNLIDIIGGPVYMMNCLDPCAILHANYPKPLKTNVYSVNNIAYSPQAIGGTVININDDKFTGAIPIGFDFCFFDHSYSQCYTKYIYKLIQIFVVKLVC